MSHRKILEYSALKAIKNRISMSEVCSHLHVHAWNNWTQNSLCALNSMKQFVKEHTFHSSFTSLPFLVFPHWPSFLPTNTSSNWWGSRPGVTRPGLHNRMSWRALEKIGPGTAFETLIQCIWSIYIGYLLPCHQSRSQRRGKAIFPSAWLPWHLTNYFFTPKRKMGPKNVCI